LRRSVRITGALRFADAPCEHRSILVITRSRSCLGSSQPLRQIESQ
jgi:hypothetical protein